MLIFRFVQQNRNDEGNCQNSTLFKIGKRRYLPDGSSDIGLKGTAANWKILKLRLKGTLHPIKENHTRLTTVPFKNNLEDTFVLLDQNLLNSDNILLCFKVKMCKLIYRETSNMKIIDFLTKKL